MFNEKAFRAERDLMVRDIPETMKLLKKIHDLLVEKTPEYAKTPDALETAKTLALYVKHGGTF